MNKYLQEDNRVGYVVHGITMSSDRRSKERKRWISDEHPPAILRARKVLNIEAAPVFYGANTFAFDTACALSEFKGRVGSNFRLLKDIHVKSVSTGRVKRLSIALCCLTLGTNVTVGGFLHGYHNLTIDRETGWVCSMLRPFIAQHWEWKLETPSSSGSYTMTRYTNEEERKQRFDSLRLVAKPGMRFMLKDRSIVRADKDNDLHTFLKDAVLEKWERVERENEAKAKERAERISKK